MDLYRHQVREISEYAMFTLDSQGILQSWNAGVERLLGYSEQEWLGQPASIIFTPAEKSMEVFANRKSQGSGVGLYHRHSLAPPQRWL
jgi:PAS domain S-box-containing protein